AALVALVGIGGQLDALAVLFGRDDQLIALGAGDETDHHVVILGLDHRDAAAGALELGDLVGAAPEHVDVARRDDDDIAVVARDHADDLVTLAGLGVAPAG